LKVRWSRRAEHDLDGLVRYTAMDSVEAALRLEDKIVEAAAGLDRMPGRGRPGRWGQTRELVVLGTKYVLVYRITDDVVSIVRVRHTSQYWPPRSSR
jgi:toxin ParE1/3/4